MPGLDPIHVEFYYGDLADVDYSGSVAHSLSRLSRFGIVVTGEPGGLTPQGLTVLQSLVRATQVFGYMQGAPIPGAPVAPGANEAIVDRCAQAGYAGIYIDIFGGVSSSQLNAWLDYAHGKGLRVIANVWAPTASSLSGLHLQAGDWTLFESLYSRSDGYYGGGRPGGRFADALKRYQDGLAAVHAAGVKAMGLAYSFVGTPLQAAVPDEANSYLLAVAIGLDGWSYGNASNNEVPWPDLETFRLPVGGRLLQPLRLVDATQGLYEAETDAGIIRFVATDNPPARSAEFVPSVSVRAVALSGGVPWGWLAAAGLAAGGLAALMIRHQRRSR